MDGRGGCCIARYGGGRGYDSAQVDRIMLRFRPIAPKPVTATSGTGSSLEANLQAGPRTGGGKRRSHNCNGKFNGVKRCNTNKKRKSSLSKGEEKMTEAATATLPLLPDTPARGSLPLDKPKNYNTWLSFSNSYYDNYTTECHVAVSGGVDRVIGSCVIVECVTDAWMEGEWGGLGSTDEERKRSLENDTCPGFVCDSYGRVTWTNEAYKKMVREGSEGDQVVAWLVAKDKVPVTVSLAACHVAFTCRVRVEYGRSRKSVTVPCDVWRLDGGGFAWRLDVNAALRLGR